MEDRARNSMVASLPFFQPTIEFIPTPKLEKDQHLFVTAQRLGCFRKSWIFFTHV
jgi:hypothetical protein